MSELEKYTLIKNTDWKEVEINGEMTDIPSDWGTSFIGKTIKLNMGSTPKKESNNYEGELPWITITNLTNKQISHYTAKIKKTKNIKVFPKGTLLISFKMSVGKAGFTTEESAINEAIMGIKKEENGNNLDYLYYCLPAVFLKNAMPNGQGLLLLNQEKIKDLNFITPPLPQQSSISAILSQQESVIENIESLIEKYEARFRYLSDELLSGRLRAKEINGHLSFYKNPEENWKQVEVNGEMTDIPSDWGVDKIQNLFDCSMGQTILSKDVSKIPKNNHIPVYSATEEDKYFGYIEKRKVRSSLRINDLVIPARGNSIGFCKIVNQESTSTQTTIQVKSLNKISSKIVFNLFKKNKESFFPVNPGTIPQLTVTEVNAIEIFIPKENEQSSISAILSQQEDLIQSQKDLLIKEKQKFEWLLENLLSGKYLVQENLNPSM